MSRRLLLDTCVISDLQKGSNVGLDQWFAAQDESLLYISILTIGEIHFGIAALPRGRKRVALESWLRIDVIGAFEGRLLPVDIDLMTVWAETRAAARRKGNNNQDVLDMMLAATAIRHDLDLVTRNARDFHGTGVSIVNPWR